MPVEVDVQRYTSALVESFSVIGPPFNASPPVELPIEVPTVPLVLRFKPPRMLVVEALLPIDTVPVDVPVHRLRLEFCDAFRLIVPLIPTVPEPPPSVIVPVEVPSHTLTLALTLLLSVIELPIRVMPAELLPIEVDEVVVVLINTPPTEPPLMDTLHPAAVELPMVMVDAPEPEPIPMALSNELPPIVIVPADESVPPMRTLPVDV